MASTKLQSWRSAQDLVSRLLREDAGQDLIEYVLLTAAISLGGVAAFQAIGVSMNTVYTGWDAAVQSIWESPDPQP